MSDASLLSMLQLTDPALPIGGYAHSSGLETYVQKGLVYNVPTAGEFARNMLNFSLQFTDAAFVSLAYDAAQKECFLDIEALDEECTAVKLAAEVRLASQKLGIRLLKIFQALTVHSCVQNYLDAVSAGSLSGHYSIAFGICAAALDVPKRAVLAGFYYNAASSIVTNCVKLIPLGQQDGQELLFSLQPLISELVDNTMEPDRSLVGLCCPGFDMRCMQHERLYSRLYMS